MGTPDFLQDTEMRGKKMLERVITVYHLGTKVFDQRVEYGSEDELRGLCRGMKLALAKSVFCRDVDDLIVETSLSALVE